MRLETRLYSYPRIKLSGNLSIVYIRTFSLESPIQCCSEALHQ